MLKQFKWHAIRPYLVGGLGVLIAGLIVNELHSLKESLAAHYVDQRESRFQTRVIDCAWLATLIVAWISVLRWWHSFGPGLLRPRTRKYGRCLAEEDPREHLVLFLSALNSDNSKQDGSPLNYALTNELQKDLDNLAQAGSPYWPWEQMLRAICPHLGKLKTIYCFCSHESFPQAEQFKAVLHRYKLLNGRDFRIVLNSKAIVSKYTASDSNNGGVDFEDFDQLARLLRWLFGSFRSEGISEKSVVVDFTGGKKITSVVAVAETFDRDVTAQYVQTGGEKDVFIYDVIVDKTSLEVPVK